MSKITSQINKYSDEVLCALAAGGCQDAEEELVKRYFSGESVLPRILSLSGELARFVGAHSVRPRADNVRPYIKSANRTHPKIFARHV